MNTFISGLRFKGKNRLIRLLAEEKQVVIPYSKSKILVDTGEHIGFNLYWNGGYENEVVWILDKIIDKDSVCVDIGANIGIYTILCSEKGNKVISFEPHPAFHQRLLDNIERNGFKNVTAHQLALSSEKGGAILFSPPDSMRNKSATMKEINSELTEKISVKKDTLDNFLAKEARIDFIKIDTDGSDADVILGGKELIKKFKPTVLFEYIKEFPEIKARYDEAMSFLKGEGYELFEVLDRELKEFDGTSDNFANILAIKKQHGNRI